MKHAHIYLAAIVLLHAVCGALAEAWFWSYVPDGGPEGLWMVNPLIYWTPLFLLLWAWCRADTRARHARFSPGASMLVSILFPIGVPYYFFKTYARREALLHAGLFLVFVGACLGTFWLSRKLTFQYYAVWTNK